MSERPSGGSAASTGCISTPKIGLAKTSDTPPSTSDRDEHLDEPRAQLAEVLQQRHPQIGAAHGPASFRVSISVTSPSASGGGSGGSGGAAGGLTERATAPLAGRIAIF